jgi:hypothetical protein
LTAADAIKDLRLHGEPACKEAVVWARQHATLEAAWAACQRGDWMAWYLCAVERGGDLRQLAYCWADRAVRVHAVAALRAVGQTAEAERLAAALAPIKNHATAKAAAAAAWAAAAAAWAAADATADATAADAARAAAATAADAAAAADADAATATADAAVAARAAAATALAAVGVRGRAAAAESRLQADEIRAEIRP